MRRWLLSIGVRDYGAQPGLPDLPAAVGDACCIYKILTREFGFEGMLLAHPRDIAQGPLPDMAKLSRGEGTATQILEQIRRLGRDMGDGDLFVLHYAGHGLCAGGQRDGADPWSGYLAPAGALRGRPATYLAYADLAYALAPLPCAFLLLLVGCSFAGLGGFSRQSRSGHAAVLALARDGRARPDQIEVFADGQYSPFAYLLGKRLDRVSFGEGVGADELASDLIAGFGERQLKADGNAVEPYFEEVPQLRRGRPMPTLRRLRFYIDVPARIRVRQGEQAALTPEAKCTPKAKGLADSEGAPRWRLLCPDKPKRSSKAEGWKPELPIEFAATDDPVVYVFILEAQWYHDVLIRTVRIEVAPAERREFAIASKPLDICWTGRIYEAQIEIVYGHPPYEGNIRGLPSGLEAEIYQPLNPEDPARIEIRGKVPAPSGAGTARSHSALPIAHHLEVEVMDAHGHRRSARLRLLVVSSEDYRRLEAQTFRVGYDETPPRDREIERLCRESLQWLERHRFGGVKIPDALHDVVARQQAQQTVGQALGANPGSEASTQTFLIRKYPVTNLEWREFVLARGEKFRSGSWTKEKPEFFAEDDGTLPAVDIPYEAILEYLAWRGTRLPTAWEWELAARGEDGRLFPWGDEFTTKNCNVLESEIEHLTSVDCYDAISQSPLGVCDMVGNAAEWVERRIFARINGQPRLAQPFRGGSFLDPASQALTFLDSREVGVLFGADEENRRIGHTDFKWLGFRDVVDLDPAPQNAQALIEIPSTEIHVNDRETRQVPVFKMARYAVSNSEYMEFVSATGHPPPPGWKPHDNLPFPSFQRHLPVVHVSYRDALAFCLWKSRQTGTIIRLPTRDQFRAALTGGEQRKLPWGNEFDLQRCNCLRSGWGRRVPVDALPQGQSKHGIYNLVGNVWEWVGPEDLMGGSWRYSAEGFDFWETIQAQSPVLRDNDAGFRYVENHPLEA